MKCSGRGRGRGRSFRGERGGGAETLRQFFESAIEVDYVEYVGGALL